jgi:putative lipoprotein
MPVFNWIRAIALLLIIPLGACQSEQRLARQLAQLSGTSWKAERIGESAVPKGIDSTLEFEQEGDVAGSTGCNVYVSQLLQEQRFIRFTEVMKAGVKCSPEAQEQEDQFVKALASARRIQFGRDRLVLMDENDKAVLDMRRMPKLRL